MRRVFVIILGILVGLGVLGFFAQRFMISETKKHSPEMEQNFRDKRTKIDIHYSSPFKKNRVIFGNLVPYGQVWRTGANEPTTFQTNVDLVIKGEVLPAGKYTLWTIPESKHWKIIFNERSYDWGVSFGGKASREEIFDRVIVECPVQHLSDPVESLKIWIEKKEKTSEYTLNIEWDKTLVAIDMEGKSKG